MAKIIQIALILLPILVWTDLLYSCPVKDQQQESAVLGRPGDYSVQEREPTQLCHLLSNFTLPKKQSPDILKWHGAY